MFFLVHQLSSIIINRINFPQRSILKPWLSSDTVLGPVGREQALPSAALGQTTQQKGRRRHQNLQQEAICYISQSLQLHRIHLNSMYFIVFLYAFLMCFWLFLSCWMVWADFNGLPIIGTARLCTAAKEANIFVASPKDSYALQLSRCAPILFLLQTYFSSKCATTLRQQLIAGQASYSLLWGNAAALGRVSVQYAASRLGEKGRGMTTVMTHRLSLLMLLWRLSTIVISCLKKLTCASLVLVPSFGTCHACPCIWSAWLDLGHVTLGHFWSKLEAGPHRCNRRVYQKSRWCC